VATEMWINVLGVTVPVVGAIITLYTRVAKLETLISIKMDNMQSQLAEMNQGQKDLWHKYGVLEGRLDAVEQSIITKS
jgi:hypothetical protein